MLSVVCDYGTEKKGLQKSEIKDFKQLKINSHYSLNTSLSTCTDFNSPKPEI